MKKKVIITSSIILVGTSLVAFMLLKNRKKKCIDKGKRWGGGLIKGKCYNSKAQGMAYLKSK